MKLKYIIPILLLSIFTTACSNDDDNTPPIINEVEGLIKFQEISNSTYTVELFNEAGMFYTGYNKVSMRIKDNATNAYLENAAMSWMPMMQMPTMQHSCPKSAIVKADDKNTVYEAYVVYQMTNADGSGWSLTLEYTINGADFKDTEPSTVMQSEKQNATTFMGSDESRYIIAMIEPVNPKIAINELKVGLFKMENMMMFPEVANYKMALDPRMPGMGNHTSPNNTDLSFNSTDKMYYADLSLTMTGYWVLNLKLINDQDTLLKGEDVTDTNKKSSLYLELEF